MWAHKLAGGPRIEPVVQVALAETGLGYRIDRIMADSSLGVCSAGRWLSFAFGCPETHACHEPDNLFQIEHQSRQIGLDAIAHQAEIPASPQAVP